MYVADTIFVKILHTNNRLKYLNSYNQSSRQGGEGWWIQVYSFALGQEMVVEVRCKGT